MFINISNTYKTCQIKSQAYLRNSDCTRGFTLIEILVALSIVAVIGSITVSILFMTLRAGKKSDVLIGLKQNGNTAMAQIVKNIRYAKSLDYPTSCVSPVTVPRITLTSISDNAQTTFTCTAGASTSIASNGASLIDTSVAVVSGCSFTCSQATLNDPPTIAIGYTLNARNLTDLTETRGSVRFNTSVIMRNYLR